GIAHGGSRALAAAQIVGAQSQTVVNLVLLHLPQRLPQLARQWPVRAQRVADRSSHVLLQPLVLVRHLLLLARQFFRLFARRSLPLLLTRRAERPPHLR